MKKILVTGSNGFLGMRCAAYYSNKYTVLAPLRKELDITDKQAVTEYILSNKPDYVIHAAAVADMGVAENDTKTSDNVNVNATIYITDACNAVNAKLIFMSSDQVYNGNSEMEPFVEEIALSPSNAYGNQKLKAEQYILSNTDSGVCLRLTWMYDLPNTIYRDSENIITNLYNAQKNNSTVKASASYLRAVTNVWDVVKNIELCFDLPKGAYNFGSESNNTMYELYDYCAKLFAFPDGIVVPYESTPKNLCMNISKIQQYGINFKTSSQSLHHIATCAVPTGGENL